MRPIVVLEGRPLPIFPVLANKKPATPHGFKDATADPLAIAELWRRYPAPLVGVPTGAVSSLDCIDIDPRNGGDRWFHQHRDEIPKTRTHETRSLGLHLIFRSTGLRCSAGRLGPGVDTKGTNGFIVWWPASAGRVLCDEPLVPIPDWIVAAVTGAKAQPVGFGSGPLSTTEGGMGVIFEGGSTAKEITPILPPTDFEKNYAQKALGNAFLELRACQPGRRNELLNILAYKMGRLIARGWIQLSRVEMMLEKACEQNGLIADDGISSVRKTTLSGLCAGARVPYRDIAPPKPPAQATQ